MNWFSSTSKIGPIVTLLPEVAFNKLNEIFAASRFGIINKFAEPLKREPGMQNDEYFRLMLHHHAFHLQLQALELAQIKYDKLHAFLSA